MDIIDSVLDKLKWAEFLEYKLTKSHLNKREEKHLIDFVMGEKYLDIAKGLSLGAYTFSTPKKTLINKSGSSKKKSHIHIQWRREYCFKIYIILPL